MLLLAQGYSAFLLRLFLAMSLSLLLAGLSTSAVNAQPTFDTPPNGPPAISLPLIRSMKLRAATAEVGAAIHHEAPTENVFLAQGTPQNGMSYGQGRDSSRLAMSGLNAGQNTIASDRGKSADDIDSSLATAIRSAHFGEPIVATSPTDAAENLALSKALEIYKRRGQPDDVSSLTTFISDHPHSGWVPALLTNLGLSYLHYGYFSRAIDAWQKAWIEGKQATEPHSRALVDGAVGNLARLYASLGKMDELAALFDEIGDRRVTGSSTEAIQTSREELSLVKKDPRHLFICGPVALKSLMLAQGAKFERVNFLQWYRAGPNGTNLAEVAKLADKAEFSYRLIFRKPGQTVPTSAIVHWKVGHFAAIVGEANGRFHIEDPVFPGPGLWVTQAALDAEASGYYLVPAAAPVSDDWRSVGEGEASAVWGKGPTNGTRPGDAGDPLANNSNNNCPLCGYNIAESSVAVTLADTPVGYSPPIGPSAKVQVTYNQREDSQPQNFSFFNISPKWTLNWLTYVTDDPTNPGANVTRYLAGGGAFFYTGYNNTTGQFAAQDTDGSILVLTSQTPITYQRQLADGSIETYGQSDGSTAYPRNIFLTQKTDPQGNAVNLNYDSMDRLISLTDATGRQTTFTYGSFGQPLLVTQIADPFGRSASLTYDSSGRLSSITDIIGLTSSFTYDSNSLVNSLTTPYGTTSFAYTAPGPSAPPRFVQVTDPLGYNERVEWLEPAPIPDSDPVATVPQGMPMSPTNQFLTFRDSFHWDKNAYIVAGCTPTGGCDYTKARNRHFNHVPPNTTLKSTSIESVKYPLENRIWYSYPGQPSSIYGGTYDKPIATGRVLDDGTTQLSQFSYDTGGYFKLTQAIDPVGRTTSFAYPNHVDLTAINQTTQGSAQTTIAQFTYDSHHRPLTSIDAAGQTTTFTYNAAEQLTSITNPLNQVTTYQYDSSNNLITIINASGVTAASFTYDAFDRIATSTDSEGWTAAYSYDNANRLTKVTYPDGTADSYTYDKLDPTLFKDRLGRVWRYTHDADRRLTATTDPLGLQTLFGYNGIGELTSLTDPKGNATSWTYDVEGRLSSKQYADSSTVAYTYENTTSRLASITDALGQTKQYSYTEDNRIAGLSYLGAVNPTPNVSFVYDPYFPRTVSMTDGNGTTQYSYVPVGTLGALQLQQESSPLTNSSITYAYDELGRPASRTVAGAGSETLGYDAIGRLISHASDLGSFTISYLGQTQQIAQRQLLPVSANLATTWSYLANSGDRRLVGINAVGLSTSQYSTFQYTTTPENFITGITETSDSPITYPSPAAQTANYNNLNQVASLSSQAFSYDADGNLLSDGARTYTWDAENRLVGIAYPGQSGKATAFAYDGLSRRTAITSTPAGGGSAVATSYVWCGTKICQARSASDVPTREYFSEGEFVPGSSPQPYYYGPDQIGSVRRVFASASTAPAYKYDPYGNALQSTARLTDFNYAGMFYNGDSGLYLTQYRAYDPVSSRWLSRDPIGEIGDPSANLYRYVNGNPISLNDPDGRFGFAGAAIGAAAFGLGDLALQLYRNGGNFGCVNGGEVAASAALGGILGFTLGLAGPELFAAEELGALGPELEVAAEVEGEATTTAESTLNGPSSLYDDSSITRAGSQYLNVQTDVSATEFQQNLISNGYNVVKQSQGATVLNNGTDTWTIYTRTSTGAPGAQFFGGNGAIVKYSLGGP
jgi:RHS repeat-associated protein